MTPRMAEIFPRRGRAAKKAAPEPTVPSDPLEAMASEIRALDAAATSAAERIKAAADKLGEGSGQSQQRVDLMGGVATALVDRTDQIRADCERLSSLMDRTAKLVAAHDARTGATTASPEPATESQPPPPAVSHLDLPRPEPVEEEEEPETVRPRWLERDDDSPETSQSDDGGTSEGVRLIATQMAIAGSSRSEIEHRLRIQFGVVDAEQALNDIFGNRRSGVQ